MTKIIIISFFGLFIGIIGYLIGHSSVKIDSIQFLSVVRAIYAESNVSILQIRHYKGQHEYLVIRTLVEIPKPEEQWRLYKIIGNGNIQKVSTGKLKDLSQPEIEGEGSLKLVDEINLTLIAH